MVKKLTNRQILLQISENMESLWIVLEGLSDRVSKIEFGAAVLAIADGKTNLTIISPEPLENKEDDYEV